MSDRLTELRRSVEQPPSGFDWDENAWRDAGGRALSVVAAASTQWANRRPSPEDPDAILKSFSGPLPRRPVSFQELVNRIEREVLPTRAYNGHPRWRAYLVGSPAPDCALSRFHRAAFTQNSGALRVATAR